jgi:hypothetical protein
MFSVEGQQSKWCKPNKETAETHLNIEDFEVKKHLGFLFTNYHTNNK